MSPPAEDRGRLLERPVGAEGLDRVPAKMAIAVLGFLTGPLVENPFRVGKELPGESAGLHVSGVGPCRVVNEIDAIDHLVPVIYIDHRADVYRTR